MKKASIICIGMIVCLVASGCSRTVSDYPLTINNNDIQIEGKFTGTLVNDVPEGEGTFTSDDTDSVFSYTGLWENGKFTGEGYLKDDNYTVHFSDLDRTGKYDGQVMNGIPSGEGTFTAENDDHITYTYIGQWADGTWNGQGVQKFESDQYYVRTGNFTNGEFNPSKLEYIKSMGDYEEMRFSPTEKAEEFITAHENLFPAADKLLLGDSLDENLTYKELIKSPDKYGDKVVKLSGYEILQIWENSNKSYTETEFLACNSEYDDYISVFYLGELPGLLEGTKATVYGLPVNYTKFQNVSGGTTLCYVLYGCAVEY